MSLDTKALDQAVKTTWEESITDQLKTFITIPNQSPLFDPEWATNGLQDQVVDLFLGWMKEQPLQGYNIEVVKLPNLTPLIFMEVESTIPGETKEQSMENTVLMYGHFDKQPPLTEQWEESLHPYRPVLRGDKVMFPSYRSSHINFR